MDFLTGIGSNIVQSLLANPAMQAMVMGVAVKVVVDKLKEALKLADVGGVPADKKVLVQKLVLVCSFVATCLDLWLKGQLSTLNPQAAVEFVATLVSTHLLANGTQEATKAVKAAVKK